MSVTRLSVQSGILRFGSGVPSSALGSDGDYYVDEVSKNTYKKITGSWTTSSIPQIFDVDFFLIGA